MCHAVETHAFTQEYTLFSVHFFPAYSSIELEKNMPPIVRSNAQYVTIVQTRRNEGVKGVHEQT